MLDLAWPWVLLVLPLPLLVYWLVKPAERQLAALRVPFFNSLPAPAATAPGSALPRFARLMLALLWCLLVVAASRPQWVGEAVSVPTSGRDLMLAVDTSGSMDIPDMVIQGHQVPRILVVKQVVGDFVERRQGDRLGLIVFGTRAFLLSPLTFDRRTVNTLLQETQLGFAGEKTAIGDAIGLAIKRLKDRPADKRVLILLTDGANTAGEIPPRKAADLARQAGVKIYTVGVGAEYMRAGGQNFNPSADLDEETLRYIADQTGGAYLRARDPSDLFEVYELLDQLEPTLQEEETFRPIGALFHWPLAMALVLSFALACWYLVRVGGSRPAEVSP